MRKRRFTSRIQFTVALLAVCIVVFAADRAHAQNNFVMDDNQFNGWLFRGAGQMPDQESEITLMVEAIDRSCHLTPVQQEKLRLAGQGDYARFQQRVDELRTECVGKTYDQNQMQELYQKFQPLVQQYQGGMLGSKSLFSKVVHQTLTPEQFEEYEASEAERRKTRHIAKVRLFVALLEQSCPMTSSQRDQFVGLLLKETRPPLRSSEYDWYVVIVQVSKIPESKLKPILDPAQLAFVKKVTARARNMEAMLKQMGVLPRK